MNVVPEKLVKAEPDGRGEKSRKPKVPSLTLGYTSTDIFQVPDDAVLVHACNCMGHWGAGFAAAVKKLYPIHYQKYNDYCRKKRTIDLRGTCLLIAPPDHELNNTHAGVGKQRHWIACLFTKHGVGNTKEEPSKVEVAEILSNTHTAMSELLHQIHWLRDAGYTVGELHMPKINSGLFGVPWRETVECLGLVEDNGGRKHDIFVHVGQGDATGISGHESARKTKGRLLEG